MVTFYDLTSPNVWVIDIFYKQKRVLFEEAIEASSLFLLRIKVGLLLTKALPHLFYQDCSIIVLDEEFRYETSVNPDVLIVCNNTVIEKSLLFKCTNNNRRDKNHE